MAGRRSNSRRHATAAEAPSARTTSVRAVLGWLGVLVAALAWSVELTHAQGGLADQSGTTVLFQVNRSTYPAPVISAPFVSVTLPQVSHTNLNLDTRQFVPNLGVVRGTFDLSGSGGPWAPSRGFVGLSDVPMGDWTVRVDAGDHPLDPYALDLGLSALYRPLIGLRGGGVTAERGHSRVSVFAGRTSALNGFFAESVLVSEQTVGGVRAAFRPVDRLRLAVSALRTHEGEFTTSPAPLRTMAATASAVYDLTPRLSLVTEGSVARSDESSENSHASGPEPSVVVGARFASDRSRVEVSTFRLAPSYLPYSYTRLGDRAGLFARGDYRLGQRYVLYGSVHRWHDHVGARTHESRLEAKQHLVGARVELTTTTHASGRVGLFDVQSPRSDGPDSRSRNLYVDVTRQFGVLRLATRLNEIRTVRAGVGRVRRRVDVEVRRRWRSGLQAWTTVGGVREVHDATIQSDATGTAGLSLPVKRTLSLFSEATWNRELSGLDAISVRNVALTVNANWDLPRGVRFTASGRYSRDRSVLDEFLIGPGQADALTRYLLDQTADGYQLTLRMQKRFGWGRPIPRRADANGEHRPPAFGSVEGIVFNDLDGDGRKGVTEPGVPNVGLVLGDDRVTVVGPTGHFDFGPVRVGRHRVALDLVTVPASYDLGPRPEVGVTVGKGEPVILSFPLIQLSRIRGRLTVAEPRGGLTTLQRRERPGTTIVLRLIGQPGKDRVTTNDAAGSFQFTSLPAGEYRIEVETRSLPDHWSVRSVEPELLTVTPGERIDGVEVLVIANPRPTRRVQLRQDTIVQDALTPPVSPLRAAGGATGVRAGPSPDAPERVPNSTRGPIASRSLSLPAEPGGGWRVGIPTLEPRRLPSGPATPRPSHGSEPGVLTFNEPDQPLVAMTLRATSEAKSRSTRPRTWTRIAAVVGLAVLGLVSRGTRKRFRVSCHRVLRQ